MPSSESLPKPEVPRRALPCFPCPHKGACCAYGADLDTKEAHAFVREFGALTVVVDDKGAYRTAVKDGTCVFHSGGLCAIHETPLYPKVCRAYPWEDGLLGGMYSGDRQECPEFWEEAPSPESAKNREGTNRAISPPSEEPVLAVDVIGESWEVRTSWNGRALPGTQVFRVEVVPLRRTDAHRYSFANYDDEHSARRAHVNAVLRLRAQEPREALLREIINSQ
jgi:Putative zinc- or iron-chelating domain